MIGVALGVVLRQRLGAADGLTQVARVAGHLVQAQIGIPVFAHHVWLHVILAQIAPSRVARRARIRRRVRYLRVGIPLRRQSVLQFVIKEGSQKCQCPRIASIGIQPLHEALHHGAQIPRRVSPVRVRMPFEGGAVKVHAAIEIRQPLAIVLVPHNRPLTQKVRGVGVTRILRHGKGQQLALGVQVHRAARDRVRVDNRDHRKVLLLRQCQRVAANQRRARGQNLELRSHCSYLSSHCP